MSSISALSLRIPVQSQTLIGLDFPLTKLVNITEKRKQFLTYTQEKPQVQSFSDYDSARLIQGDQKITVRQAKALYKTNNS
jgi:hypothetical protein